MWGTVNGTLLTWIIIQESRQFWYCWGRKMILAILSCRCFFTRKPYSGLQVALLEKLFLNTVLSAFAVDTFATSPLRALQRCTFHGHVVRSFAQARFRHVTLTLLDTAPDGSENGSIVSHFLFLAFGSSSRARVFGEIWPAVCARTIVLRFCWTRTQSK